MLIKKIKKDLFDVFFGAKGFDDWARITVTFDPKGKRNFVKQVAGVEMPAKVFQHIVAKFN